MTNFVIVVLGESLLVHVDNLFVIWYHCGNHITVIANILTLASISFYTPTLEPFLKREVGAFKKCTHTMLSFQQWVLCSFCLVQPESTEDWSCVSLWTWDLHVGLVSCWSSFRQIGTLRCPYHLVCLWSRQTIFFLHTIILCRVKESSSYSDSCCLASATFSLVQLISLDDREFTCIAINHLHLGHGSLTYLTAGESG